ncbi:acyltransferase [Azohydromonas lata]|uniref:acyltransferase n=1 Tax=Azohydromonas lata TaxID=45677 RepID=UPI000830AD99|nr:acyltransferase [Azohydromonas lata]
MSALLKHFHRLLVTCCVIGAWLEFFLWADNHRQRQFIRRLYLRLKRVRHGRHVYCGPLVMIRSNGNLTLGERCALGYDTRIWNYAPISIGDDFMAAAGLTINAGSHDVTTMRGQAAPVRIGHRVWCGLNVSILAGVTVGDDVVIAAGAVVTRDIPSGSVAAGIPARVVRALERDPALFDRSDWC